MQGAKIFCKIRKVTLKWHVKIIFKATPPEWTHHMVDMSIIPVLAPCLQKAAVVLQSYLACILADVHRSCRSPQSANIKHSDYFGHWQKRTTAEKDCCV